MMGFLTTWKMRAAMEIMHSMLVPKQTAESDYDGLVPDASNSVYLDIDLSETGSSDESRKLWACSRLIKVIR